MHRIKHNKTSYLQDLRGYTIREDELLDSLGGVHNEMMPEITERINTADLSTTCRWCNTASRQSETRNGHCPFCWRLI